MADASPPKKKPDINIDDIKEDIIDIATTLADEHLNQFPDKHADLIKFATTEASKYNPSLDPQEWSKATIDDIQQMYDVLYDMKGGKLRKTKKRKTKRRKSNNRKKSKRRKHKFNNK